MRSSTTHFQSKKFIQTSQWASVPKEGNCQRWSTADLWDSPYTHRRSNETKKSQFPAKIVEVQSACKDKDDVEELSPDDLATVLRLSPIVGVMYYMAIFGMLSIRLKSPRIPSAHPFKTSILYCIAIYIFFMVGSANLIDDNLPKIFAQDSNLDERLGAIQMVCQVLPSIAIPGIWMKHHVMTDVALRGVKYEMLFSKVTSERLQWNRLKRNSTLAGSAVALGSVLLFGVLVYKRLEIDVQAHHAASLVFSNNIHILTTMYVIVRCKQLEISAIRLLYHFKKLVAADELSPEVLRQYRNVWIRMRETLYLYNDAFGALFFVAIFLFAMQTISVYLTLANIIEKKYWRSGTQCFLAIVYVIELYLFTNASHRATSKMTRPFASVLDLLAQRDLTWETYTEITLFYKAFVAKPPAVSLLGFAYSGRPLFSSMMSTLVTYIIVLVQFKQSVERSKPNHTAELSKD